MSAWCLYNKLEKLGSGDYFKPQNPIFLISAKNK